MRHTNRALAQARRSFATGNDFGVYTGNKKVPFVSDMEFVQPNTLPTYPAYRIMDDFGNIVDGAKDPEIGKEECLKIYETMIRLFHMDTVFYEAQRHGRISFYMQNHGEEACTIGSAAALQPQDMIYGQYREAGALMYRGFSLQQFADQCFSNNGDPARGRQMPVHYGSAELNFQVRPPSILTASCKTRAWSTAVLTLFIFCLCTIVADHLEPSHDPGSPGCRSCVRLQVG